MNLIKT